MEPLAETSLCIYDIFRWAIIVHAPASCVMIKESGMDYETGIKDDSISFSCEKTATMIILAFADLIIEDNDEVLPH